MLVAKCRNCGGEFPSPIQLPTDVFNVATITDNKTTCPHCKKTTNVSKSDISIK
ncbi:hypothetical protein OK414_02030 [Priestia sp. JV24]|uniref:hypothetical protein n=1 Tax=Priestia TaxID=2800373 RepID=UPI0021D67329|nr:MULTISPECIES: hypothetical protein [Priestia]MCU7712620.1 hypothetical protein [Priestia megaterium]MCW1043824.1 hypothetical protein [Priestia sp. JV24]